MKKLRLDVAMLSVQSFQTAGVQPADLSGGTMCASDRVCNSDRCFSVADSDCTLGCDCRGVKAHEAAHSNEMFDGCAPIMASGGTCMKDCESRTGCSCQTCDSNC